MQLFFSPMSRASRVLWLLEELDLPCDIVTVSIRRSDGSGAVDARNPHPDGKVPALLDGDALVTESIAIFQYLCEKAPEAGLAPAAGSAERGPWLSWLAWYAGVYEPVIGFQYAGVGDNPVLVSNFRGRAEVDARLLSSLEKGPWLVGDRFTAADLLFSSSGSWAREILPEGSVVDDWLARCFARPALARAEARELALQG